MKIKDFYKDLRKEAKENDAAERIATLYDNGMLSFVDALREFSDLITADYYGYDKTKY